LSDIESLNEIIGLENDKPIDIRSYIKRKNSFPNTYIVYRIMLMLLLMKRVLSKLQLIKSYLRSTMSQ